jgi:hypothetical protein
MKKVINNNDQTTTSVDNVNVMKYYGISHTNANSKGFITRENYESGLFVTKCISGLTNGNCWSGQNSSSLINLIKQMISSNYQIFEFDTYREILQWLSQ